MSAYSPSQDARDALKVFLNAVRQESVLEDESADNGLASEYRKAMAVLRACASEGGAAEAVPPPPSPRVTRVEPDPDTVRPFTFPTLEMSVSTSPGVPAYAPPAAADSTPVPPAVQAEDSSPAEPAPPSTPVKDQQPAVPVAPDPPQPSVLTLQKSVTLRNARAGEPYADILVLEGGRDIRLVNAGRSGLAFDPADWTFSGTPEEAGDFELKLKGRVGDRPAEITAKLAVIPDPKSLWTSLPSDPSKPFWKPDEAFAERIGARLRMIGASKRGRSHAKTGGFREDDFALAIHGPWHIAAVADGAGSAPYSRRGSRLAVETVEKELPALIDLHLGDELATLLAQKGDRPELEGELRRRLYETLAAAAFKAVGTIERQAEALNEPPARLSTTLMVVIARELQAGWFVAAFSVGDGGAALLDLEGERVEPLTAPDSGEYAGQTRFLARAEFADYDEVTKRLAYATPERFTAIALMSDGITDPKLPTDKAFADPAMWSAFWSDDFAKQVDLAAPAETVEAQFLAWLDFWSPGNHDDRTLAVLLPREG